MKKLYLLLLFLSLITLNANSQIVNIESQYFYQDTNKFVGKLNFNEDIITKNNNILILKNSLALQYKNNNIKYLLYGNNHLKRVNKENADFDAFINFRIRYSFNNKFKLEYYNQWNNDQDVLIYNRWLTGVGIRNYFIKSENLNVILSTSLFYEKIQNYETKEYINGTYRTNISFVFNIKLSKFELSTVFYTQPNLVNINDYKFDFENSLNYNINKIFSIEYDFSYSYNNKPFTNVVKNISEHDISLNISF